MIECYGFSVLLEPAYSGPAMSPTAAFELGDADASGALNATEVSVAVRVYDPRRSTTSRC
jgi:hypothetical protein